MHGTNKITTEFASQMMHMHFNGITGDLFIPGIQFSSISLRGSTRPALRISNSSRANSFGFSVKGSPASVAIRFAGVEHDVTVAQLVAGLAVGSAHQSFQPGGDFYQRKRFTQIIVSSQTQPFYTFLQRIARSGSVPAHADLFLAIRAKYRDHPCLVAVRITASSGRT